MKSTRIKKRRLMRQLKQSMIKLAILPVFVMLIAILNFQFFVVIDFYDNYQEELETAENWKDVPGYDYSGVLQQIETIFNSFSSEHEFMLDTYLNHSVSFTLVAIVLFIADIYLILVFICIWNKFFRLLSNLIDKSQNDSTETENVVDFILGNAQHLRLSSDKDSRKEQLTSLEIFHDLL